MVPSYIPHHERASFVSLSLAAISRNALALAAMTLALVVSASLAYVVLRGTFDRPINPTTVLVAVGMVSLVVLTAILLILGICRIPVMQAARGALRRGSAPMVCTALAVGITTALATPYRVEGAAILVVSGILVQTAVLRAAVARKADAGRKALLDEPRHHEQAHPEGLELVAVMQQLACRVVDRTGAQACRLFTLSSDREALVLRGETGLDTMGAVEGPARPPRVRLPVRQLMWLERLLQQDGWLNVPSDPVTDDEIGREIRQSLKSANVHGELSLRALHVAGSPVGVACLIHSRDTSPADRARQQGSCDVVIDAAEAVIERALRLRSLELKAGGWSIALRELPYGLAVVNQGTRLMAVNAAAEAALSTPAEDVLGRRLCDGSLSCACPLHLTLRTGQSRQAPLRSIWPFPLAEPVAGQLVNIWATTIASNQAELVVIALSATPGRDPAPRIGGDVAAMISHELRAPLATLRASSELALEEMSDPEQQRRLLSVISRQVDRLDHLVQDLADVFRLQAGKLQLSREVLDVPELCHELVGELDELGMSHRIEVQADESVRAVAADRLKIRTVLMNLVSNATKYAPEDTEISITVVDNENGIEVSVADKCSGIDEEDLPYIFEQFYRSPSVSSASNGYGLGLYITRALVELHGGYIRAESGKECGCRITFILPRLPNNVHITRHQAS